MKLLFYLANFEAGGARERPHPLQYHPLTSTQNLSPIGLKTAELALSLSCLLTSTPVDSQLSGLGKLLLKCNLDTLLYT